MTRETVRLKNMVIMMALGSNICSGGEGGGDAEGQKEGEEAMVKSDEEICDDEKEIKMVMIDLEVDREVRKERSGRDEGGGT